jgi:hypothetical protein
MKKPISVTHPELAAEWHPTLNADVTPEKVSAGSHTKVWWLGKCEHSWEAQVAPRVRGNGCPICAGKVVISGFNDLRTTNQNLADEWHPTLNHDLTPYKVSAGSGKKVWWLGKCGHEWEQTLNDRKNGSGCPICQGREVLAGYNDLATTHPELAAEWHPTLNGSLTPENFSKGTHTKIWWLDSLGHEWEAVVHSRTKGNGCPFCSGRSVLVGFNDLETKSSELADQWHPSKNEPLKAKDVVASTNNKFWWLGKCGHEWQASCNRRLAGTNCPYCSSNNSKPLAGFNDLATTHPELASEWHPTKNGDLTAKKVVAGSNRKVWWLGKCSHEWQVGIAGRALKLSNCPYCSSSNSKPLAGFNDLATTHPELASEWHPTKNGASKSIAITAGSGKKIWWVGKCGHEWQSTVAHRVNGRACPFCSGKHLLVGFNDLQTRHPTLAEEWHATKNGNLTPSLIHGGQPKQYWWVGKCGHEWRQLLTARVSGAGCPSCSIGGFRSTEPGTLYFLHNSELQAFKVGITNKGNRNDRIAVFGKNGWQVIFRWDSESGLLILNCETRFFQWLRRDRQIPVYLDKETIGSMGGQTETFSDSILTRAEVIAKIDGLIKALNENE